MISHIFQVAIMVLFHNGNNHNNNNNLLLGYSSICAEEEPRWQAWPLIEPHIACTLNSGVRLRQGGLGSRQESMRWCDEENQLNEWTYFLWLKVDGGARIGPVDRKCAGSEYGRQVEEAPWHSMTSQTDRQTDTLQRHHAWMDMKPP
jgi:hypothetical protein